MPIVRASDFVLVSIQPTNCPLLPLVFTPHQATLFKLLCMKRMEDVKWLTVYCLFFLPPPFTHDGSSFSGWMVGWLVGWLDGSIIFSMYFSNGILGHVPHLPFSLSFPHFLSFLGAQARVNRPRLSHSADCRPIRPSTTLTHSTTLLSKTQIDG